MAEHPIVEDLGLGALRRALNDLDGSQSGHGGGHGKSEDELLERLVAKLNRPGGPKISSRAVV